MRLQLAHHDGDMDKERMSDTTSTIATQLNRYRFGTVEYDEARGELRVAGEAVEVQRKPLDILSLLLTHPDEVITKEELLETVWEGRPTVENVLANAITKLRNALGEDNAARIVTVPRIGYRFSGPLERIAVGRHAVSSLSLEANQTVPGRSNFLLKSLLGTSNHSEVWQVQHIKTGEQRIYKFAKDNAQLTGLKREVTLYRVLHDSLGQRRDLVRIIDWNFETAPFFLECEYGGPNLLAWAEEHLQPLTLQQRLDLFLQIADVVAVAHSVGVLHKDIKPANILIATDSTQSFQVKLTDFGSGRLLNREQLEKFGITQLGFTVTGIANEDSKSGTQLYIAPEIFSGHAYTVQSDIYALGIILYQLIDGSLKKAMAPGWELDIDDELLREDIAAATDGNLARRLTSVAELAELLRTREQRREERQRIRASELRALLAEQALQRSRARRPWLIGAVGALTLGLLGTTWFYFQSQRERSNLQTQNDVLAAVQEFMLKDFIDQADPKVAGHVNVTVAEAAKAALPKIDLRFRTRSPAIRATLHAALLHTFTELSDFDTAVKEGQAAIAAYLQSSPINMPALIHTRLNLAYALSDLSRYKEASAQLDIAERDIHSAGLDGSEAQVELLSMRGTILDNFTSLDQSAVYLQRAKSLAQSLTDVPDGTRNSIAFNLGATLTLLGHFKESEQVLRDLVNHVVETQGPHASYTLFCQINLAQNLANQKRLGEAQALAEPTVAALESTLGRNNQKTIMSRDVLADIYFRQHNFTMAEKLYREDAAQYAAISGDNNTYVIGALINAATAAQYLSRTSDAEQDYRHVLALALSATDKSPPQLQAIYYHLADCLLDQGKTAEVESLLSKVEPDEINDFEIEPDWPARLAYQQGRLWLFQRDYRKAIQLFGIAIAGINDGEDDGRITKAGITKLINAATASALRFHKARSIRHPEHPQIDTTARKNSGSSVITTTEHGRVIFAQRVNHPRARAVTTA